jgi:hypothetical protein
MISGQVVVDLAASIDGLTGRVLKRQRRIRVTRLSGVAAKTTGATG